MSIVSNINGIENLESISRNGAAFTARYEKRETYDVQIGHTTWNGTSRYTGRKLARGKAVRTHQRQRDVVETRAISQEEAAAIINAAKDAGQIKAIETIEPQSIWVVRF